MNTQEIKQKLEALEAEYAAVLADINRVEHHIDEETLLEEDGGDKDWLVRARHARRKLVETRMVLKPELSRLRKLYDMAVAADARSEEKKRKQIEHEEHQKRLTQGLMNRLAVDEDELVRQRLFVVKARETLSKEVYLDIWNKVHSELA